MLFTLSLGLQYEKVALYDHLRCQIPVPRTPFEHVLFVSADVASRTLDMVWLVFGFDPFGFRLCRWNHGAFAYAVVNPILKGMPYSGPHRLNLIDDLLCTPTNRCSLPQSMVDESAMQCVLELISRERRDAYGRAVMLLEMTCDENLIACFREETTFSSPNERLAQAQVRARLIRMYGRKKDDPGFLAEVDAALSGHAPGESTDFLSRPLHPELPEDDPAWLSVIRFYRNCLQDLQERVGLPGDNFDNSSRLVADPSDRRLVGDLPSMND
jgi:hypothetical protein